MFSYPNAFGLEGDEPMLMLGIFDFVKESAFM